MKAFAKNNYSKLAPIDDNVIVGLDEIWHFLHSKKTTLDLGSLLRTTKQLIDWECGARDAETFRKNVRANEKVERKDLF